MSAVDVRFDGFDASAFPQCQSAQTIDVTEAECLHAAETVGAPYFNVGTPPDDHAVKMASYKALAVALSLDFSGPNAQRRAEYDNLDSTEKRNLSYWLGMTFASIAGQRFLGVTHFFHAETMLKDKRLTKASDAGRRLADLVGSDASFRWHVVEAKSQQVPPSPKTIDKWRSQAKNTVDRIDGVSPASSSCSSLVLSSPLAVTLYDPPSNSRTSLKTSDGIKGLFDSYYAPWLAAIGEQPTFVDVLDQRCFLAAVMTDDRRGRRVEMGLTPLAYGMALAGPPIDAGYPLPNARSEPGTYIGKDGVFVRISTLS
ncbi:MAG: hypothetical protein ACK5ZN_07210 [Phycisphaerales bacterium]|jgi:hypothetical protein